MEDPGISRRWPLLVSFSVHCNYQLPHLPCINLETIKSAFFIGAVENYHQYLPYTENMCKNSLSRGIRTYLLDKKYNQNVGDMAPLVLANAFCVSLTIMNEAPQRQFAQVTTQRQQLSSKGTILLHRAGDNYSGIVPTPHLKPVTSDSVKTSTRSPRAWCST